MVLPSVATIMTVPLSVTPRPRFTAPVIGQMIKFNDLRNATYALLEVRDLLEVVPELDERSWSESVRIDLELTMLQRVQI